MQSERLNSTAGMVVRSLVFNLVFYLNLIVFLVCGVMFFFTPRKWSIRALQTWAQVSLWWMRIIVGTTYEVRGLENIPEGGCLLIGKHQSFWETFALLTMVDDPAIVLKRELTYIPVFGWFALKFEMIAVDRGAAASALRNMVKSAKKALAQGRQIMIFPEGTRKAPGAEPDYKPGAAALYLSLKIPAVPFGLNSGLYWPRRKFMRYPGTIIIEFGPPIPADLKRKEFSPLAQEAIEGITDRLVQEGREKDFSGK
ncbi:Acyl-CoA:1-acyl-sn-glycerol-3-phosphate acyltransferase [hydrothermal vent metagenome]|uniref:Acyl-CoA:1-acyl-sn-glycerol-3-phosphate acyltransferase n=1 Tax=hydrothermal vent metagenome TaxID=652676 RepID=A0A3B0SKA7_9ZZZZ